LLLRRLSAKRLRLVMPDDNTINFGEEEVKLRREKRLETYRKVLDDIEAKKLSTAITLLEDKGYTVIPPA
jgi:hypothetical protein